MPTYLTKIEATYYYRRPVPPDLQPSFLTNKGNPRGEWMESLRTKDRRTAEERLHRRDVEVDELIREAAPPATVPSDLMALFDRYVAERRPAPASVKAFRRVMQHLIDAGHSDPAKLTMQDVVRWKDALLAEKDDKGEPARGAGTVRETYLAALKVVLGFGVENGELSTNVAQDVRVRAPKKVRLREPQFSHEEAVTILRAALGSQPDSLSPEHRLARRWVPWLCAYSLLAAC